MTKRTGLLDQQDNGLIMSRISAHMLDCSGDSEGRFHLGEKWTAPRKHLTGSHR